MAINVYRVTITGYARGTVWEGVETVWEGDDLREAEAVFKEYVTDSRNGWGRAGDEDVTLFEGGEPIIEYYGEGETTA